MCEHEYENANCTNCANGLGRLEYECAKTQGKLKEYCHNRAKEHEEQIRSDERTKVIDEVFNILNGIDCGIRCAMCTNMMSNDKGCDGGCVVDDVMLKRVLNVVGSFAKSIEQLKE